MAIYNEDDPIDDVLNRSAVLRSKFLAWMEANCKYPEARGLTYAEFPTRFVWVQKTREWKPRDKGFAIGRITYVPPKYVNSYSFRSLVIDFLEKKFVSEVFFCVFYEKIVNFKKIN